MAVAIHLEQQGAAIAVLIMTAIDLTHIAVTEATSAALESDLMRMQGINATLALILLAMASVMHERRVAQQRLRAAAEELEQRVAERTEELVKANLRLETEVYERTSTEDALRASEDRLAKAQELAHIGSFEWDAATDRNHWSSELFRIYGLDERGGPPGFEQYISFIRADERDHIRTSIQHALETGEALNHEYPVLLPDGRKKWVQAYIEVLKNDDGTLAGLRGTCQDVTERKVAEAALRWSEGRFRVLLESAPDAVIVVDPTGKIVLANKQTEKILGYDREELLGQPVEVLLPSVLREGHVQHRHTYNAQPEGRPMGAGRDLFAQRKDGTRVAVDISLSPVETDSGFLVFALMRDASERRRVEDALRTALDREREATEDLRKLDRAKNAFLSAVSHELRTPLTAILGFAELLEEPNVRASDEMTSELVGRVRYSASRLNDLLGDLLDLDRLHRGIVEPRRRATSLRNLVVRALAGMELGPHPLSIEVDDAMVQVDPAQTERIVENLVSNAVRYTPPGTNIYLQANASPDGGVVLAVEDEGPGVPSELWTTIFEPFVRADTGTFTQGTGIGLALVDRFAKLHGGSASVGERPGGGASFHVILPGVEPAIVPTAAVA
jgi:PAS domain S-box-containing protein